MRVRRTAHRGRCAAHRSLVPRQRLQGFWVTAFIVGNLSLQARLGRHYHSSQLPGYLSTLTVAVQSPSRFDKTALCVLRRPSNNMSGERQWQQARSSGLTIQRGLGSSHRMMGVVICSCTFQVFKAQASNPFKRIKRWSTPSSRVQKDFRPLMFSLFSDARPLVLKQAKRG